MSDNLSSRQTKIELVEKYAKSRILTLGKQIKKEKDREFKTYLIGQEIALKEIVAIICDSSNESIPKEDET